ncbi:hypothetical protein F6455_11855 [Proteobacteria bacterium 005FR1]|nr:hypothetical protein [Proteobacteria bacterium 005FR1]
MTDKPTPSSEENKPDEQKPAEEAAQEQSPAVANSPESTETPESSEAKAKEATRAKPRKARSEKTGRGGGWVIFFLSLIFLAGLGALGYYQWLNQQDLQATMAGLNARLEGQVDQISQVSREVEQAEQEAARAIEQVSQSADERQQQAREMRQQAGQLQQQLEEQTRQLQQQLNGLRQQIQAITTTTTDDWKLAEAYYLTRLAGQRLLMERDTQSALALLESADKIVRNYPDPNLYPVREALADDIAELKLAEAVDREGLYLKIAALSRQITQLNFAEPRNFEPEEDIDLPPAEPEAEPVTDEGPGWWNSIRQSFAQALARLEDFVRVTRHEEPIQPLLAPDQQLQLRSSVQTALDTAQLALMREQPAVYQTSLEKAQELIARFYAESDDRGRILAELEGLESAQIRQELPDITESQEALGKYLDQRHRLAPEGAREERGGN